MNKRGWMILALVAIIIVLVLLIVFTGNRATGYATKRAERVVEMISNERIDVYGRQLHLISAKTDAGAYIAVDNAKAYLEIGETIYFEGIAVTLEDVSFVNNPKGIMWLHADDLATFRVSPEDREEEGFSYIITATAYKEMGEEPFVKKTKIIREESRDDGSFAIPNLFCCDAGYEVMAYSWGEILREEVVEDYESEYSPRGYFIKAGEPTLYDVKCVNFPIIVNVGSHVTYSFEGEARIRCDRVSDSVVIWKDSETGRTVVNKEEGFVFVTESILEPPYGNVEYTVRDDNECVHTEMQDNLLYAKLIC